MSEIHVHPDVLKRSCFGRRTPRYKNFYVVLSALLAELPFGTVVHSAAAHGVETCALHDLSKARTVRAIEADPKKFGSIARFARRRPNMRARRGVLGDSTRNVTARESGLDAATRMYTLDALVSKKWQETISLLVLGGNDTRAHHRVLEGAAETLAREAPAVAVHGTCAQAPRDVLAHTHETHEVYEAGNHVSCIFVPRSTKLLKVVAEAIEALKTRA